MKKPLVSAVVATVAGICMIASSAQATGLPEAPAGKAPAAAEERVRDEQATRGLYRRLQRAGLTAGLFGVGFLAGIWHDSHDLEPARRAREIRITQDGRLVGGKDRIAAEDLHFFLSEHPDLPALSALLENVGDAGRSLTSGKAKGIMVALHRIMADADYRSRQRVADEEGLGVPLGWTRARDRPDEVVAASVQYILAEHDVPFMSAAAIDEGRVAAAQILYYFVENGTPMPALSASEAATVRRFARIAGFELVEGASGPAAVRVLGESTAE